jgi:hypothetical protein
MLLAISTTYTGVIPVTLLVIRGLSSSLAPISADTNTRIHLLIWSPSRHTFLIPCLRSLLSLLFTYGPHTHSKMFIGGLNWDTTDGTSALASTSFYIANHNRRSRRSSAQKV